jgi:hypothetical protein
MARPDRRTDDEVQPRLRGEGVLAEPLDGVDVALPDDAHAHQQEDHDQDHQRDKKAAHHHSPELPKPSLAVAAAGPSGIG